MKAQTVVMKGLMKLVLDRHVETFALFVGGKPRRKKTYLPHHQLLNPRLQSYHQIGNMPKMLKANFISITLLQGIVKSSLTQ
jgi:hypothetical protein